MYPFRLIIQDKILDKITELCLRINNDLTIQEILYKKEYNLTINQNENKGGKNKEINQEYKLIRKNTIEEQNEEKAILHGNILMNEFSNNFLNFFRTSCDYWASMRHKTYNEDNNGREESGGSARVDANGSDFAFVRWR